MFMELNNDKPVFIFSLLIKILNQFINTNIVNLYGKYQQS